MLTMYKTLHRQIMFPTLDFDLDLDLNLELEEYKGKGLYKNSTTKNTLLSKKY